MADYGKEALHFDFTIIWIGSQGFLRNADLSKDWMVQDQPIDGFKYPLLSDVGRILVDELGGLIWIKFRSLENHGSSSTRGIMSCGKDT